MAGSLMPLCVVRARLVCRSDLKERLTANARHLTMQVISCEIFGQSGTDGGVLGGTSANEPPPKLQVFSILGALVHERNGGAKIYKLSRKKS